MGAIKICTAGNTPALKYAAARLNALGYSTSDLIDNTVTHMLLPIPSFSDDGTIRGGLDWNTISEKLPDNTIIFGGNLPQMTYPVYDLLQDPLYVAENAYITAHCAVRMMMDRLPVALRGCKVLVIGWGRIGKCLATLLKNLEADVTVAARKEADRAILNALGYKTADTSKLPQATYRVIFNTAPAMIIPKTPDNCLKIDLASTAGLGGSDVLYARGLPGKDAPEASGDLIARTISRILEPEVFV